MYDMIKLDWQPRGSVPTAEDYPLFYHYDSAGLVYCPHPSTTGSEGKYPWARLRIAPPEEAEAEADPLSEWRYALGIREAMIAASNAPSADAARRWYNDRFLEVMKREGV
jgi:hypothetical protein